MKGRPLLWFFLLEALVCLFVFRDAMWGKSLLAPVDIAPALFSKYRFVNPDTTGVPANHYIVDQLFYDLPIQKTQCLIRLVPTEGVEARLVVSTMLLEAAS